MTSRKVRRRKANGERCKANGERQKVQGEARKAKVEGAATEEAKIELVFGKKRFDKAFSN